MGAFASRPTRASALPPSDAVRVFVLSAGGTGTRTIFFSLCSLGIRSVHSLLECHGGSGSRYNTGYCRRVSPAIAARWYGDYLDNASHLPRCRTDYQPKTPHDNLQELWRQASSCAQDHSRSPCQSEPWARAVHKFISTPPLSHSVTDTPWASFPSAVAARLARERNVRVVIARRNATEWARSAIRKTPWDPICAPDLWSRDLSSPYDLLECVSVCKARTLGFCLVPVRRLSVARLAEAFDRSERALFKRFPLQEDSSSTPAIPTSTINLFERGAGKRMPQDEVTRRLRVAIGI